MRVGHVKQSREDLQDDCSVYEAIAEGWPTVDYGTHEVDIRRFIAAFNFTGTDQDRPISTLSGGERNRAHLAKMIKHAPNVLLLDEPSNDLDVEVLRNLENAISEFAGTDRKIANATEGVFEALMY